MADASGPPTSPDNIPTYATAADPPSGKGFNTAMAAIQAALTASYLRKPAGIAINDPVVWNGTGWSKPSGSHTGSNFLRDDGSWAAVPGAPIKKSTSKTVNTTTAATDLLNGEITLGAGVLGTVGIAKITAWGDWKQNSGGSTGLPRFQLVLGATTLVDTSASAATLAGNSATREPWKVEAIIANSATNVQSVWFRVTTAIAVVGTNASPTAFTTGEGWYGTFGNTSTGGNMLQGVGEGFNTGAVDTTASLALILNVINPSANANTETKLYGALVELV